MVTRLFSIRFCISLTFYVKCDRPYRKPRQKRSPIGFVDFLGFGKRTVVFMGMQVSMPQYLRLRALQNKVIKLDQIIKALQARYTDQELELLPQYARLKALHQSLSPFLPNNQGRIAKQLNLR